MDPGDRDAEEGNGYRYFSHYAGEDIENLPEPPALQYNKGVSYPYLRTDTSSSPQIVNA